MRVLVTGANGFIGRHLIAALSRQAEVTAFVRRPAPVQASVRVVEGDIRDAAAVREAFQGAEAVIHLAGLKADACAADPAAAGEVNVTATGALLEEAQRAGVKRFLLVSSYDIYGPRRRKELPCHEQDEPRPSDAYGMTKALAERLVQAAPMDWTIVRLGHVYGAESDDVVTTFLMNALHKGRITVRGSGRLMIDPIVVEDVVDVLIQLLSAPAASRTIVNVASGNPVTIRELAEMVREAAGRPGEITFDGLDDAKGFDRAVSIDRLRAVLPEFRPRSLRDGLHALEVRQGVKT